MMWYWFRGRMSRSPGMSRAQFRHGVKIFILPLALVCIALKLALVLVYHQSVFGAGWTMPHFSLFGVYLLCAPVAWFAVFRWWMRRQNRGRHHRREPGQAWYSDRR